MSLALVFDPGLNDRWRGAVDAHLAHAMTEWPREACGLIDAENNYVPCENRAENPENDFEISSDDYLSVAGGEPVAVLHSHVGRTLPSGETIAPYAAPSKSDMVSQIAMGVPWGISLCVETGTADPFWFGDQVPKAPLIGRLFRSGVHDCWSLIRDWHAEVPGIYLPDFPRDGMWWENGEAMYDQFADAGFEHIVRGSAGPEPGDSFICTVMSNVRNHGGVYIGDGLLMHHLQNLLSAREPAAIWSNKMDFLVRHKALPEGWDGKTRLFEEAKA